MWPAETEVMVSQLCLMCGSTLNCQTLCLEARPRYSLVVDEDVKKPTNQPTNSVILSLANVSILQVLIKKNFQSFPYYVSKERGMQLY